MNKYEVVLGPDNTKVVTSDHFTFDPNTNRTNFYDSEGGFVATFANALSVSPVEEASE